MQNTMSPARQEAIHQRGIEIKENIIQTCNKEAKQKQLLVSLIIKKICTLLKWCIYKFNKILTINWLLIVMDM